MSCAGTMSLRLASLLSGSMGEQTCSKPTTSSVAPRVSHIPGPGSGAVPLHCLRDRDIHFERNHSLPRHRLEHGGPHGSVQPHAIVSFESVHVVQRRVIMEHTK